MNSNNRGFDQNSYMIENIHPGIVRGINKIPKKRRKLFFLNFINVFLLET